MSTTRESIADALSKVDALAVTTSPPAVVSAGSAWPVWAGSTWRNACATDDEWFAFVCLPNGSQATTVDAGDALVQEVATVLWAIGKVERVEPWAWPVDQSQSAVPVLRFTLNVSGGV